MTDFIHSPVYSKTLKHEGVCMNVGVYLCCLSAEKQKFPEQTPAVETSMTRMRHSRHTRCFESASHSHTGQTPAHKPPHTPKYNSLNSSEFGWISVCIWFPTKVVLCFVMHKKKHKSNFYSEDINSLLERLTNAGTPWSNSYTPTNTLSLAIRKFLQIILFW